MKSKTHSLKQAEIFVMLAIIFLLGVVFVEKKRKTAEDELFRMAKELQIIIQQLNETKDTLQVKQDELQEKEDALKESQNNLLIVIGELNEKETQLNLKQIALEDMHTELNANQERLQIIINDLNTRQTELEEKELEFGILQRKLTQAQEDLLRTGSPIVVLSEKQENYSFTSGDAVVPDDLKTALEQEIIPKLEENNRHGSFNAIEVIGHTDDQPIGGVSNLDKNLIGAFTSGQINNLAPGSNVDLGMMRALAVMKILTQSKDVGHLPNIKYFFPSSAGQMIDEDQSIARQFLNQNKSSRRRVEIRMLKYEPKNIQEY